MIKKLTYNEIFIQRLNVDEIKTTERHPIYVVAHNIRSLYNVGSLFRTCDSSLVTELILTGYTPHPPRKEIEKTALGAVDTVPWQYFEHFSSAVNYLKQLNVKVSALELTDNSRRFDDFEIQDYPLAIVLGNEISGIDDEALALCDDAIEIPMYGVKHSLNVSVAAGIAIYSAVEIFNRKK